LCAAIASSFTSMAACGFGDGTRGRKRASGPAGMVQERSGRGNGAAAGERIWIGGNCKSGGESGVLAGVNAQCGGKMWSSRAPVRGLGRSPQGQQTLGLGDAATRALTSSDSAFHGLWITDPVYFSFCHHKLF
jgi:hypothetical protein